MPTMLVLCGDEYAQTLNSTTSASEWHSPLPAIHSSIRAIRHFMMFPKLSEAVQGRP